MSCQPLTYVSEVASSNRRSRAPRDRDQSDLALGGDPTAETPCADVSSVASSGILKVITDPRTNVAQTLQALLAAELIDTASWELLIMLVEKSGKNEFLKDFKLAYEQEIVHQETIKSFLRV